MTIPIVGVDRSPKAMIPLVLPDMLRAVDSVCRRHGVPPATAIVCLMVAATSGARQLGLDPMVYVSTALEAWAYVLDAEERARPPDLVEPPADWPGRGE